MILYHYDLHLSPLAECRLFEMRSADGLLHFCRVFAC